MEKTNDDSQEKKSVLIGERDDLSKAEYLSTWIENCFNFYRRAPPRRWTSTTEAVCWTGTSPSESRLGFWTEVHPANCEPRPEDEQRKHGIRQIASLHIKFMNVLNFLLGRRPRDPTDLGSESSVPSTETCGSDRSCRSRASAHQWGVRTSHQRKVLDLHKAFLYPEHIIVQQNYYPCVYILHGSEEPAYMEKTPPVVNPFVDPVGSHKTRHGMLTSDQDFDPQKKFKLRRCSCKKSTSCPLALEPSVSRSETLKSSKIGESQPKKRFFRGAAEPSDPNSHPCNRADSSARLRSHKFVSVFNFLNKKRVANGDATLEDVPDVNENDKNWNLKNRVLGDTSFADAALWNSGDSISKQRLQPREEDKRCADLVKPTESCSPMESRESFYVALPDGEIARVPSSTSGDEIQMRVKRAYRQMETEHRTGRGTEKHAVFRGKS